MNELIAYPIPVWVKVIFLIAIPAPVILTTILAKSAFPQKRKTEMTLIVARFYFVYIVYVSVMGISGMYDKMFFPPMVLLYTTFPFAFFLFLYVIKTKMYRTFLENVRLEKLVAVHIFRLIGSFFIILALYDALPKWFAFIAGTGDILTAITSIWVANQIKKKKNNYKKIIWFWNTFGLADIIFTAVSANVITKISIDKGIMGVDTLAQFPFWFIPALAPPIIVFLHYSTYQKLKMV